MSAGWLKFAILGSTYARALENANVRAGRPAGMFASIAQQPLAKLKPGASAYARAPGPLTPTPQQKNMQEMMSHVPWAGAEHVGNQHGNPFAENALNAQLRQRGLEYNTPAGQPNIHQQIAQRFGPPPVLRRGTQIGHASGDQTHVDSRSAIQGRMNQNTFGGSMLDIFDGPQGHREHLPELTRHGVGPQRRAPIAQPAAVNRPDPHVSNRVSPIGGRAATSGEGTVVLPRKVASLPIAAGVGIPLAVGGALLASKPGIKANVRALREGGSTQERDVSGALPPEALGQADAIHKALVAHGLDPATVRMGIDAPPGSGKTTLARALSQRAGLKHYGLDWEPGNWWKSTVGLGRNIEKTPRAPHAGEVLEHYMLGRTYDPELFDAMVHIHRDPEVLKQQLQQRGHGAYIGDLMDLNKSLGVADLGFQTLGGEVVDLGNGVQMKLRPREGWGDALDQRLMQAGIDPTGLSRHEKLLSLHAGKRTTGAGWTPYVKSPFSGGEAAVLGASVPLGVMAARALSKAPRAV